MTIHVLGVPIDLGAGRRGVDMGPSAIRIAGLAARLAQCGHMVSDEGDLDIRNMEEIRPGDTRARYLEEIARVSGLLAAKVEGVLDRDHFPLVLGGDHSIAVGTIAGIAAHCRRRRRKLGVLWIDAHTDMNTPESSPSGNIHGMPMAALLGLWPGELGMVGGGFRKLDPARVVMVGIRSVDEGERGRLRSSGVHVFTMADIDRLGVHRIMTKALGWAAGEADHLHVSFDLDAVDPSAAPGVGTPVRGGLSYREAHLIMEAVAESGVMASMEVAEVNPILDDRNASAELAVELIQSAFGKRIL
ncbi:MAG: arginase [Bacteroidota bacterium]